MTGVPLSDSTVFHLVSGLWRGNREPLQPALVLRSTNFRGDGLLDYSDVAKMPVEAKHLEQRQLRLGDLIIERSGGGPRQPVGRVAYFDPPSSDVYFTSNFTTALRVIDKERFDPRFVELYLHGLYLAGETDRLQRATTGIRNLDWQEYLRFQIPALRRSEQETIARTIGGVRRGYLAEELLIRRCTDLKRATMQALFTRGLRGEAQKETEIGPIPESWEVATLQQVSKIERGRFLHRPRNDPRFYGGCTPFVQTGDVVRSRGRIREFTQTLNADGVAISRVFPAGTVLITIAANIGYTGILTFDSACPDSLVGITPNEVIRADYLEYWLQTQQAGMDRAAPKGTQKNINIQFLLPWPVALPPLDEQDEIIALLSAADRKIDLHRRKRAMLDDLFKALLHKLITGEIRVGDLDLPALAPPERVGAAA